MRECSQLLPDSSHHKANAYDECFRCSQAAGKASHSASGPCLKRRNANHDWTRHAACESVILYLLRHISKSILGARTATQLTTAKQADARPKPARPRDVFGGEDEQETPHRASSLRRLRRSLAVHEAPSKHLGDPEGESTRI